MKYLIAKIKDIINNPRLLVKATMYLVVVSIGVDVLECFKYFSWKLSKIKQNWKISQKDYELWSLIIKFFTTTKMIKL